MVFISYTEKLSFYAAISLLIVTITIFSIPPLKTLSIGYLSILWGLFILHRLFFIMAPETWRQNINKKLSVRLLGTIDKTPQNIKSAIIWRLSQWDVVLFIVLITGVITYVIFNDFIMSPNNSSSGLPLSKEITLKITAYLYNLGTYLSIYSIYMSIFLIFFTFSGIFAQIKFNYLMKFLILGLLMIYLGQIYSKFVEFEGFIIQFIVALPIAWCFIWPKSNVENKVGLTISCLIMLFILVLTLETTNHNIIGDIISLICLPFIGYNWAKSKKTPFDAPPSQSFDLTINRP